MEDYVSHESLFTLHESELLPLGIADVWVSDYSLLGPT